MVREILLGVTAFVLLAPGVSRSQDQAYATDAEPAVWNAPPVAPPLSEGYDPEVSEVAWDSACCGCAPCCPQNFIFGQALFLHAKGNDVAHAQQQNGTGGAGTTPFGRIGELQHDWNAGFKVGMGCCLDECSDILLSYSFFETDANDSIVAPTIGGGGGAVGSLVHHPAASITASVGPVDATQFIQFQSADLLYRHNWFQSCFSEVNAVMGMQYGHLEQKFTQTGNFGGGSAGVIDTASDITFDGGGLKFGLEGERRIRCGVAVYSRLTAAALTGRFHSNYSMRNSTTAVDLALANWSESRVIGQVEYELGLGWTSCDGRWHARGGYMFSHWTNVVTMPQFIDAVQADNYTDLGDTITFDGAVARLECRW